jgi:hypothetical protein
MVRDDDGLSLAHLLQQRTQLVLGVGYGGYFHMAILAIFLSNTRPATGRGTMARVALVEPHAPVPARAPEPFPVAVRTLDAVHLATAEFLPDSPIARNVVRFVQRLT